jgi:hypothetical protein
MTTCLEKLHQIMKLAMNITANSDWTIHWLYIRFFNQNLFDLDNQERTIAYMMRLTKKQKEHIFLKVLVQKTTCSTFILTFAHRRVNMDTKAKYESQSDVSTHILRQENSLLRTYSHIQTFKCEQDKNLVHHQKIGKLACTTLRKLE